MGAEALGGGSGDGKGFEEISESVGAACCRTRGDQTAIARATERDGDGSCERSKETKLVIHLNF